MSDSSHLTSFDTPTISGQLGPPLGEGFEDRPSVIMVLRGGALCMRPPAHQLLRHEYRRSARSKPLGVPPDDYRPGPGEPPFVVDRSARPNNGAGRRSDSAPGVGPEEDLQCRYVDQKIRTGVFGNGVDARRPRAGAGCSPGRCCSAAAAFGWLSAGDCSRPEWEDSQLLRCW